MEDEKDDTLHPYMPTDYQGSHKRSKTTYWRRLLGGAAGLLGLVLLKQVVPSQFPFDTRDVSSYSPLSWTACPDVTEFQCAFLNVPMNYLDPRPNETVSLALRRFPAVVPPSQRLGTIFMNPGGPGGSGTSAVVRNGPRISVIVEGKYDILSWDPRGINMTTPTISCFKTEFQRNLFFEELDQLGSPFELDGSKGREDAFYERYYSLIKALNLACEKHGNIEMLKSLGTAFAARDILSIAEALGELEQGINYWGFSYGTIIGAYFAGMFPNHIRRLINDGVSDATLHGTSLYARAQRSLVATQGVWEGFLTKCLKAGEERCALAKLHHTTSSSLANEIDNFIASLVNTPLPVASENGNVGLLTASQVKSSIFSALYRPEGWPKFAEKLYALLADRNGSLLFDDHTPDLVPDQNKAVNKNRFHRWIDGGGTSPATYAVVCGDADPIGGRKDLRKLRELAQEVKDISSIEGESWSLSHYGHCLDWKFQAYERFTGPWERIQTRFPIIYLSNTHDPVTPLASGKAMTEVFGNSSATLLIQNGYGHCSSSQPSMCTAKAVRRYFNEGIVPENGTVCDADDGFLFPSMEATGMVVEADSEDDARLRKALWELAEMMDYRV